MAPAAQSAQSDDDIGLLAEEVTKLSDTIRACDRLCLLSARTVFRAGRALDGAGAAPGAPPPPGSPKLPSPLSFIPTITRELDNAADHYKGYGGRLPEFLHHVYHPPTGTSAPSVGWYPTTSAACITALQALTPVIGRFRVGTHENRNLAFHPIEREALDTFDPKRLPEDCNTAVEGGLAAFSRDALRKLAQDDAGSSDKDTEHSEKKSKFSDEDLAEASLFSTTFGGTHPFTAAQVLRAIAPSNELFSPLWLHALFTVLWFLNRRGSSLRGHPNIQATGCPSTAVMTSKCVDAVESVYNIFERRWQRFQYLIRLIKQFRDGQQTKETLKSIKIQDDYLAGYKYKENVVVREIRALVNDIAKDTGIRGFYHNWNLKLIDIKTDDDFGKTLVTTFEQSLTEPPEKIEPKWMGEICSEVEKILDRISHPSKDPIPDPWPPDNRAVPAWVCSRNYWSATKTLLQPPDDAVSEAYQEAIDRAQVTLEMHWHRHLDAAMRAKETTEEVLEYRTNILADFCKVGSDSSIGDLIRSLDDAGKHIAALHRQLWQAIDTGVRWSEVLMNRHIGYAASGNVTLFDPNELAHAVRVVCRSQSKTQFAMVVAALREVCAVQREDGTWPCQQPFHWTEGGTAFPTLSAETALAIVLSVNEIVRKPAEFGASREEVATGLQPVYDALERFFRWLSGSIQSVPVPLALIKKQAGSSREPPEPPLYGWCSDRVYEPGTIHSWVTAVSIEFLINYRQLLQELINGHLRSAFLSHHPAELTQHLSDVSPTDLGRADGVPPVADRLLTLVQGHKALQLAEGPWLPEKPERPPLSFYSAILYGPPGSSKTFMAKAIAGELQWPLVSLSPADFLARGEQHVEAQAAAIFTTLRAGSRIVYFFDEIDELIRDRNQLEEDERSVFTFLTPSFLTKLQDLHDAAKQQEFIFILGTNYLDHIDAAAKRAGRIDEQFPIIYPDRLSRAHIVVDNLLSKNDPADLGSKISKMTYQEDDASENLLEATIEFTGFLSFPNMQLVIDDLMKIVKDSDNKKIQETFVTDLREISARSLQARFKPEVHLSEYAERPLAINEIAALVASIPEKPFPWGSNDESPRQRELKELYERIPDNSGDFKKAVEKLLHDAGGVVPRPWWKLR